MAGARVIPLDPEGRGRERQAARARSRAADAVSAGADRARGERVRRRERTTPLLSEVPVASPPEAALSAQPGGYDSEPTAGRDVPVDLPRTSPSSSPRTGPSSGPRATGQGPGAGSASFGESLLGLLGLPEFDVPSVDDAFGLLQSGLAPLTALVGALRDTFAKDLPDKVAGLAPEDLDDKIGELLAFARRRLAGDLEVDDFGFDPELTERILFGLLRPLYRDWFRVEVRGIENIPATGGALVVANHSGVIAIDALMTQLAVHDEHPARRHLRMLAADLVFDLPVIGELARKTGATLASSTDAERLLRAGEIVGVWPEGFKGIGKPFGERYKLQRFGRGGFVSAALRSGVPIVPCSIVGAEEIYPMIGNLPMVARILGLPYFPVTPTFPWLGPLGLLPLPSKWLIEFGEPIDTSAHTDSTADDPMLVFDLTDQVRQTIQQTLYSLLLQRRSVFF